VEQKSFDVVQTKKRLPVADPINESTQGMPILRRSIVAALIVLTACCGVVNAQNAVAAGPIGLAKSILADKAFTFRTVTTPHFRFHIEPGSLAEKNLVALQGQAEKARTNALMILREKDFPPVVDLFYLRTRDEMREVMGAGVKGFTDYRSRTIVLVYNASVKAYHNHEMMHVVSMNLWGYPADSNQCFLEGIAVFADNPCLSYPIHEIAAYLQHEKMLIPFDTLFRNFRNQQDMLSYMQAGSIVQYILETYGRDKFKELWTKGLGSINRILGESLSDLEKNYHKFLIRRYPVVPHVPWDMLRVRGCG